MARPTLFGHRKLLRLAKALGDRARAVGHLEIMWAAANESGEPVLGDAVDVEAVAGWVGEPGVLLAALLGAGGPGRPGFVEPVQGSDLYQIHDFWDHAPNYVKKRADRETRRVDEGQSISEQRRKAANIRWERERSAREIDANALQVDARLHDSGMQTAATGMQVDAPPAPAPAPAPAPKKQTSPRRDKSIPPLEPAFVTFWDAYPRKVDKGDAVKAWAATASVRPPLDVILKAIAEQAAAGGWPCEFTPHPGKWLRRERWAEIPIPRNGNGARAPTSTRTMGSSEEHRAALAAVGGTELWEAPDYFAGEKS